MSDTSKQESAECPKCHSRERRKLNEACASKPYQPIHLKQWHPWHDVGHSLPVEGQPEKDVFDWFGKKFLDCLMETASVLDGMPESFRSAGLTTLDELSFRMTKKHFDYEELKAGGVEGKASIIAEIVNLDEIGKSLRVGVEGKQEKKDGPKQGYGQRTTGEDSGSVEGNSAGIAAKERTAEHKESRGRVIGGVAGASQESGRGVSE